MSTQHIGQLRCAQCKKPFPLRKGIMVGDGERHSYWARPLATKQCSHAGDLEKWDGGGWQQWGTKAAGAAS